MALRDRTNSTGHAILSWMKEAIAPKRATSTPRRRHDSQEKHIEWSIDLSEIAEAQINFAELGAFGSQKCFDHPDFDNDITTYCFAHQAICDDSSLTWEKMGGEAAYRSTSLFVYSIYRSRPFPREVLHLAIHYIHAVIKTDPSFSQSNLEDLGVAAVHLAAKVERQIGFRLEFLETYNLRMIFKMERMICHAMNFSFWPTTIPFFMRLLHSQACDDSWQWNLAKCFTDFMTCDLELSLLSPALAAGVAIRLVNMMSKTDLWNPNCYTIIQHDEKEYNAPHEQLCRLLLSVLDRPKAYDPVSNKHSSILQKTVLPKKQFLEREVGIF